MYHRVAEPLVDPWGLAVQPDRFEEHLSILCRTRQPMSMTELNDRLDRDTLPRDAVAVTFDDGYADNLHAAKPRLVAAHVPATLFLTTGSIGQRTEYWWDELARSILLRDAPLDCEVTLAGATVRLRFPGCEEEGTGNGWRAWDEPRSDREKAYLTVWRRLRAASCFDRDAAMSQLRNVLRCSPPAPGDLPMNTAQVVEFAATGACDVGGHTVTHPVLPALDSVERRREIRENKRACEDLVKRSVAGFAYPHGAVDADSRAAVAECGFKWACSTEAVPVSRDADRYALPRIGVLNWTGTEFERALQNAQA